MLGYLEILTLPEWKESVGADVHAVVPLVDMEKLSKIVVTSCQRLAFPGTLVFEALSGGKRVPRSTLSQLRGRRCKAHG